MKSRGLTYIIVFVLLSSCSILNPELSYTPKNSAEYYFPPLSKEIKQKKAECMQLKNFPCKFEQNDTLNDFVNQWYSTHLASMKEPILYNQIGKGRKTLRFTHLGTWSNPYSYRIDNVNGRITGIYNKTSGLGGYDAGRRNKHEQKELSLEKWNLMITQIDSIFWNLPTHDSNMIMDGAEWILEVLVNDNYHVVTRTSPEHNGGVKYHELCKKVIEIYNE